MPSLTHFRGILLFPQDSHEMGHLSHSVKCSWREGEDGGSHGKDRSQVQFSALSKQPYEMGRIIESTVIDIRSMHNET